jgi:serine/threonine-protein kinase mTOR
MEVLSTKQHPRKLATFGSDGQMYRFLLKGHEDLRQDERVMQLFGLVNTLLSSEFETSREYLSIQKYSVIPLAPNSGLIGWVPHCDTLHGLIRSYRDARKIPVTLEHRMLLQMSPDYTNLPLINKVELLKYAMDQTDGLDLKKILWLQSETAEVIYFIFILFLFYFYFTFYFYFYFIFVFLFYFYFFFIFL